MANSRSSWTWRPIFRRPLVALFMLAILISPIALARVVPQARPTSIGQGSNDLVKQIQTSQGTSVEADNSEAPPLSVTRARVKTITGDEYRNLIGVGGTIAGEYVSFPDTTIRNDSAKTITSFTLAVQSKQFPGKHWGKIVYNSMPPRGRLTVPAWGWVSVPRSGVEDIERAAWASSGMWMVGTPGDLSVCVGDVQFADGTSWQTSR
jgi:hypothetical protein